MPYMYDRRWFGGTPYRERRRPTTGENEADRMATSMPMRHNDWQGDVATQYFDTVVTDHTLVNPFRVLEAAGWCQCSSHFTPGHFSLREIQNDREPQRGRVTAIVCNNCGGLVAYTDRQKEALLLALALFSVRKISAFQRWRRKLTRILEGRNSMNNRELIEGLVSSLASESAPGWRPQPRAPHGESVDENANTPFGPDAFAPDDTSEY